MSYVHVKVLLLIAVLCCAHGFALGQAADATVGSAEKRFARGDYFGALFEYERAMKIDSTNLEVVFGYGKTLLAVNNPKEASIYLKKSRALDVKKSIAEIGYLLAESYRLAGDYRNAKKFYSYALAPYRKDRKSFMYKRVTASKKANNWASKQTLSANKVEPITEPINSDFSEFGAQIQGKTIYYAALIADSIGPGNAILDRDYFTKIYSKKRGNSTDAEVLTLSERDKEQFKNKHLSNPSFLGKEFLFTACDTNFKCEIYRGKTKGNQIIQIRKLNKNINNSNSNNTQPQLVVEENDTILYFVSDREQGFGGLDIWRAKKETFGFDQPVNLGNTINSPDNEITPYFDVKSHQLFFSSNWHYGYGGYDIFKSEKQGIHFKTPQNLGNSINSSYNDYYFFPFDQQAILSSNRPTSNVDPEPACCNDLYELDYSRELMEEDDKLAKINLAETKVNEEELNKLLPISLYFHNDSPKASLNDSTTTSNFIDLVNQYIQLQSEYEKKYLSTLKEPKLSLERASLNQFFEEKVAFGQDQLEEISPLLLQELKKNNEIELAVRGYASSLSSSEYNLKLAARRIESLINYLEVAERGEIQPYLQSGLLKIKKLPLGEYAVSNIQAEDNKLAAIYSSDAALERKIEIIALKSSNNSQLNTTEQPKLEIQKENYSAIYRKGSPVKRAFLLKNSGNDTLKIYQVIADQALVKVSHALFIPMNSTARIEIEINTNELSGTKNIEILLITNDPINHMRKIEVELRPTD